MNAYALQISDFEFQRFQELIYQLTGIRLAEAKRVLLVGRLARRLNYYGFSRFGDYYRLLASGESPDEMQTMIDLMTTNETYFFREPQHFDFLRGLLEDEYRAAANFRIWSAASSSGEEAYSMAMVLSEHRAGKPWEVVGSDISVSVLEKARVGVYSMERVSGIPQDYLRKYCLKGVRTQQGKFCVTAGLQEKVRFSRVNLTEPIVGVGEFDVIFLRNVMIYFDNETKRQVVENMLPSLKRNGYFIVGHSESLTGIATPLQMIRPTVYRRPA